MSTHWLATGLVGLLAACGSPGSITQIDLMEPPAVYGSGDIDPFPARLPPDRDIPYATQRVPARDEGKVYSDRPSTILRVGHADVGIGPEDDPGQGTSSLASKTNRETPLVVDVQDVYETGPLTASRHAAADPRLFPRGTESVDRAFANRLNRQLAATSGKDIVIYVHGVRSNFESPILAASELQHFSGYRNVFFAFSWPASTGLLTYFQDTEDSADSVFQFRRLISYLASETDARRIHVIAHSAGTRLVSEAMGQFALEYSRLSKAQIRRELKLGHVILIGSDASPLRVGGYLIDGADRVVETFTIYTSGQDRALTLSSFVLGSRNRLGQTTQNLPQHVRDFLSGFDNLHIVDVTAAERSNTGNGHGYLRGSPWVSSDILATVNFDMSPRARGLVRSPDGTRWRFPADYPERLQQSIRKTRPDLVR